MSKPRPNGEIPKKYDREELVELVWCDLVNGLSKYQVITKLENDGYGLNTSQYSRSRHYKVITDAYNRCETELKDKREKLRDILYERTLAVYNDAFENKDRATALNALKYLGKISGAEEPEKIDINANINGEVSISFAFDKIEEE